MGVETGFNPQEQEMNRFPEMKLVGGDHFIDPEEGKATFQELEQKLSAAN